MAGSSLYWDATYPDFPPSEGWALAYYVTGPAIRAWSGGTYINASGETYQVRIPATQTEAMPAAGTYRLIARVSKAGEVHEIYNESLLVLANPATAVAASSHARQMRDAIRAAFLAAAPDAHLVSFSINNRSQTYSREDAKAELAHWEYLVALEDNPDGRLSHAVAFVDG